MSSIAPLPSAYTLVMPVYDCDVSEFVTVAAPAPVKFTVTLSPRLDVASSSTPLPCNVAGGGVLSQIETSRSSNSTVFAMSHVFDAPMARTPARKNALRRVDAVKKHNGFG